jgi:protein-tyrosine phosphatase
VTHRPLGLLYLVFSAALLTLLSGLGLRAWPLGWVAVTYAIAGASYFLGRPRWMGKRPDGTFSPAMAFVMLPYRPLASAAAFVRRLSGEAAWDEVSPGLYVGRRVQATELPSNATAVVDLTCEFSEPEAVRSGRVYRCLPTLDGCASEPTEFKAVAAEVAGWSRPTYIHCAVGHGRSAAFAAAVLLLRGLAKNADDAEALMRRARPGIDLKAAQKRLVDGILR